MARVRSLAVVALLGGLAAACSPGYQYVENDDYGVFAKIPDSWATYDERDVVRASGQDITDSELDQLSDHTWIRGFDSSRAPSAAGVYDFAAAEPRGFLRIEQLSATQREQVNLTSLRGFDLVAALSGQTSDQIDVMVDEPAEFDGYHGLHTVYSRTNGDGEVAMLDQTAVLDSTSSVLYLFVVGCRPDCFNDTHDDEITAIVDSWTIQEGT